MSELKLIPIKRVLLFTMITFAFSVNISFGVEIPIETGSTQIVDILNKAASSSVVQTIVNTTKDEVTMERINAKPMLNNFKLTPQMDMIPIELGGQEKIEIEKEMRRPENVNVIKSALSTQLAPRF